MKRWKCVSVSKSMRQYFTPGVVYSELADGSIPTNEHDRYGSWSSRCHENGVIKEDGDVLVIFCEV